MENGNEIAVSTPYFLKKSIPFSQNPAPYQLPPVDHYFIKVFFCQPEFLRNYVELDQPLPYLECQNQIVLMCLIWDLCVVTLHLLRET